MSQRSPISPTTLGLIYGFAAYLIWGFFAVYFKLLAAVPPIEILAHRFVWSFAFLVLLVSLRRGWGRVGAILRSRRTTGMLLLSSSFIGTNWFLFIWAVNNGRMLDASLGYYINPLVNVVLGMLFFGERLTRLQWSAVAVAALGVLLQLVQLGQLPVIALALAMSFGSYGLVRKKVAVDAETGLMVETTLLLPGGVVLLCVAGNPVALLEQTPGLFLLLMAGGALTAIPLLFFTAAATRLPLSVLGFLQYLAPSTMFLLAVFCYGEPMTAEKALTFLFIWAALILFTIDGVRRRGKK